MIEFLKQPWAWYVAGHLIGLTVPALLILDNKTLGISSSVRYVCAACIPSKIPFFKLRLEERGLEFGFCSRHYIGYFYSCNFFKQS